MLLAVKTRRGERMPAVLSIRQAILWIGRLGGRLNRGLHPLSPLGEGHRATLEEIAKSYG